jgi:hypothetical protein
MREQAGNTAETWRWLLKEGAKAPGILLMEAEVLESIAPPAATR